MGLGRPSFSIGEATQDFHKEGVTMIRVVPDVGAPLTVAAVNIATRTAFPVQHDWFVYGMTAVGYLAAWMGWGGDFVKNVGVSSLPLTADKIYDRVAGAPVSRRLSMSKVSRYPAPATKSPYEGVRLV